MPAQSSVAHRIPFEIIDGILQFCIVPEPLRPERDGLLAYKRLFMPRDAMIRSYTSTVRMRDRLRQVCRAWRVTIDRLDEEQHDLIVAGPDGILWPPNRRLQDATRILYLEKEMWVRIFRGNHVVSNDSTRVHAPMQRTTSIFHIVGNGSDHSSFQEPNRTVQVLDWDSPIRFGLFIFAQSAYRNLTGLRLGIIYPPHRTDPFPRLFFGRLRCLFLHLISSRTPDVDVARETFSTWSFPSLEIFHLTHQGNGLQSAAENVSSMLRAHAGTL